MPSTPLLRRGDEDVVERFSLVAGGPFHRVLRSLGMIGEDLLPVRLAAIALSLLAWLPPALLALAQSLVEGDRVNLAFFGDLTVYSRYLVAVWMMVATERHADGRLTLLIRQFRDAQILSREAAPAFLKALARADRRSSSALAEGMILAGVLAWSTFAEHHIVEVAGASWEGSFEGGVMMLSWAGQAARFMSNPLFLFLLLRWIWRLAVWTLLLLRISRLPLELAPMHPDRAAGLGFLAIYPSIFSGFVFALSCVIASSLLRDLSLERLDADVVWLALGSWLAIVFGMFVGPLLVFVPLLYRQRERALLEYGRLATRHHLTFARKWIAGAGSGQEPMGSADFSSASDLNASVDAVREMRTVPVDGPALLQLLVSAGIPLVAVVAREVPLIDVVRWVLGAIL